MKLHEAAKLVRSKNAGPFTLTIDVMFDDEAIYRHVRDSGVLTAATVARLYNLEPEQVQAFDYAPALSLKFSFPRPWTSGGPNDPDLYGGQFHSPLVDLEIP